MAQVTRREVSARRLFWQAAKDIKGVPAVLVTVCLAIITRAFVDTQVRLWIVGVVVVLLSLVILALADALMQAVALAKAPRTIEVIHCGPTCAPYDDAYAMLVVRAPDGLPTNASVAFHVTSGDFHRPLGIGTVQHSQDHETYQVTLDRLFGSHDMDALYKTKMTLISARLEFSLNTATRSLAPVTKSADTASRIIGNEGADES
jgi:hypothetical protein